MSRPRLTIDPASRLPTLQSFGELSNFLRAAVADEQSMQVTDNMAEVAAHIEVVAGFLVHPRNTDSAAQLVQVLDGLRTVLRDHAIQLDALDGAWQGLYEFNAYVGALNHFRDQVALWLEDAREPEAPPLGAVEFELNAWRMLGLGALLIDVHDQPITSEPEPPPAGLVARARSWLARITS